MAEDDALTATRLDVAEMKGMLTQALSDHGKRISDAEVAIQQLHGRVSDKGKIIAAHSERLDGHDDAIAEIKTDTSARTARAIAVIGVIIALIGTAVAVFNRVTIGG